MSQTIAAIDLVAGATRIGGLVLLAGAVALVAAAFYRWYANSRIPVGLSILLGLASVAIYLNSTTALSQAIGDAKGLLDLDDALLNTTTFLVAGLGSVAGRGVGDRLARGITEVTGARETEAEIGRLVQAVGRVITVTLPTEIEDIDGYDPVPPATKETLAGKTFLFPRGLRVEELRGRVVDRLKDDYDVGHVGVDLAEDGTVEYLALGSRAAGIGPTLAPGTAATAVRADPAYAASSGDVVQVWTAGESRRVATGELRTAAGDVVTLALDEPDAEALDPEARYRLVTLPAAPRPELEFASLLRAADETMGVVTVSEGSALVGTSLGSLEPTVVAVRPPEGEIEAIPSRQRAVVAGDRIYAIARPEALRRLESAAAARTETR